MVVVVIVAVVIVVIVAVVVRILMSLCVLFFEMLYDEVSIIALQIMKNDR